jgi:hypothetical protein
MRARPAVRARSGPFLLPARVLLLAAGVLAVGLGVFNLLHELHAGEVDRLYTAVALVAFALWLVSLVLAFAGWRVFVFIAGALAFLEFGLIASSHFVSGPAALGTFVKHEGLPLATVDMALVPVCALVAMSAVVSWSHPRGRTTNGETWPILIAALIGAVLVILQATDDLHRTDFGTANLEDGAFAAAVLSAGWLVGALWIARVRRTGAILIALSTFVVWYSFITLHLVKGGTSVSQISSASGAFWAFAAAGAAILAGASFVLALGLLLWSLARRKRPSLAASQPVRGGA